MSAALEAYRKALDLTLDARAALQAESLTCFIESLSARGEILQSTSPAADDQDQICAIIVQIQKLDAESLQNADSVRTHMCTSLHGPASAPAAPTMEMRATVLAAPCS